PEGNELCVIEADNRFLAGCGRIGAINCEGTRQVGYFWSEALGWPLVWDQDEETAIQSPRGGTKITWSGPPVAPRLGPDRQRFELATAGDLRDEVDRLVALGATRVDQETLADPDGNHFRVGHRA
ncbi:VOC family protein, partial [Nocardioides sp.]|uniref:VOC family protein n=1 Tax=Nocardioides sp. TaxID=35761 RepID=UPI0025E77944